MTIAYPAHRVADVALRDGSTVRVRPIRADDLGDMRTFLGSLSEQSRALRFFTAGINTDAEARRETEVDYRERYGLVATAGPDAAIVGHAAYARLPNGHAETAFAVRDDYQGRGLGTILLGQLAEAAAANGIRILEAAILPENHQMLEVLRLSGFPIEVQSVPGELHIRFPASLTDEGIAQFERRERVAAENALRAFLYPRSVAVIGASRQRGTVGGEVFHNLLAYGFEGPVYPVNPSAKVVQSVLAYATVEDVPGPVDLAVISVPAARVLEVAERCGRKGVRALLVLSAGFGETGAEGRARQEALLRVCRAYGMRLIGPNCLGVINTDPAVRLDATFGPLVPPPGRVAFSSQSGALGLAANDYAAALGLGFSSFISVGNKADISGNDALNYWESDPNTDVILFYLESFGNPRKFSRIARRVGRTKPILAVKSGRSAAGSRATSSHTGALLAASEVTVDALFRQAGVIRTDTLEELFATAALLANQPLPKGRRVGIVTNVGGPAIMCADACEARGLAVPELSEETRAQLRTFLPPEAGLGNPVDMIASATAEQYRRAIEIVGADPGIDAVVAMFLPPLATRPEDVADAIRAASAALAGGGPLLAVFMSSAGAPKQLRAPEAHIPSYAFPEAAVIALAHAADYSAWRDRPATAPPVLGDLRRDEAAALVAAALGRGAGKAIESFGRLDLLVVDELGYLPMDGQRANLFFQLVSHMYTRDSLVITSKVGFDQWGRLFGGDYVIASVILDRLLHFSQVLLVTGPSYRW